MRDGQTIHSFGYFWTRRHEGVTLLIDRYVAYNLSVFATFCSARAGLTPNHVSLISVAFAAVAFLLGVFLPAGDMLSSVAMIYAASQIAYVFDCADGQLARATDTTSKYGDFFDKSIDIISNTLIFGGYFAFLYRHFVTIDEPGTAPSWLLLGFFFLTARAARFAVWQRLEAEHGPALSGQETREGMAVALLKNFMDMQVSLFGMLLFPFVPELAFALFSTQTLILAAVYVRYFARAKDLYGN